MSRIRRFQQLTSNAALKSKCSQRVGAMITRGNKTYSYGYNNRERSTFLGMKDHSQHAEMAAATQFINSVVRRNPKKFRFLRKKGRQKV